MFNDETDGHIDNLACFVRPGEVCLTWTDRRRDPQHAISRDAWERLQDARDARGRRLEGDAPADAGPAQAHRAREAAGLVPREGTKARRAGERLAGSYVNFYIANGGIVMPLLDARTDRVAAQRAQAAVSRAGAWWGAGARDPARRRQHPLHHAADPARNANPITVCDVESGPAARALAVLSRAMRFVPSF